MDAGMSLELVRWRAPAGRAGQGPGRVAPAAAARRAHLVPRPGLQGTDPEIPEAGAGRAGNSDGVRVALHIRGDGRLRPTMCSSSAAEPRSRRGRHRRCCRTPRLGRLADYAALENLIDVDVVARRADGLQVELGAGRAASGCRPRWNRRPASASRVSIRASDILVALDVPSRISAQNAVPGVVEEIHAARPTSGGLRECRCADDGRDHPRRAAYRWACRRATAST